MNEALTKFIDEIKGREVLVIGIGISNTPLIKFLVKNGAKVTACDKRERCDLADVLAELESLGVKLKLGENYLEGIDQEIIFKTPGMRYDVPELLEAKKRGATVTSEMEVFFDVCPAKIIAVTGSDGKTTTTTLIHKMLTEEGYKTWLGGNIGNPLLTKTEEINKDDLVVLELSSFQLHTMKKSPKRAVITNITPNHLDMHKSYEEYIDAKKNIMLYQTEDDILVVNSKNEVTDKIGREAKGELRTFSSEGAGTVYLKDDSIYCNNKKVIDIDKIRIPGHHNVENYMAAIGACYDLVSVDTIEKIATEFGGVEHRLEFVRELRGVKYYNSSIDSSPNRTINALSVFDKKIILIAGGKDKGIPYDEIGPHIENHVRVLILIGATSDKIYNAVEKNAKEKGITSQVKVIYKNTYEDAVKAAKDNAEFGDVVLLSPASTSFDMFKNFEERGRLFKDLVSKL